MAILGVQHQRFIRASRFDEFDFTPTATPVSINVPASSRDYEQNDAELTETTSELNETQMQLGPESLGGANATFRKSSVSVGYNDYNVSVDQSGRAYATGDTYGSTHEANMIVSYPLLARNIKVGVSKSGGTVSRTFRGFQQGSLRAYLWEQMRLRVGIDDGNGYVTWRLFASLPLHEQFKLVARAARKVIPMTTINKIREFLRGKKVYTMAAAGLLGAVIAWADHSLSGMGLLAAIWAAAQACFIRAGIANELAKQAEG